MPTRLFGEIESLATCENAAFMTAATGITLALRDNGDGKTSQSLDGSQGGHFSDAITDFGDAVPFQIPLLAGMYATSLWRQDAELHELTLTMFTSYKFTVLSSVALQYATGTHHAGSNLLNLFSDSGFPSERTASTFALAAVIDEKYGWKGGLPAYLFAGVIGWSEVDQNQHTVSEVVFGAALGYVIGKSIGALHYHPDAQFKLIPFLDSYSGTQGMGFEYRY